MLRSYKKKAWPLSPRFQVLAWLVHQITALLYILPWKTPGSQETQQHPARSPASAPRLLTGDGDCALVCWSSSSPQRHESGDWALTWRTLLDCLDRTFRLFPLSIATWTLWGGQLTSFLGSTLWLRRPFFALGSWVTFSCGHYKSSILLFGTLGNTSVLRILVVDPQVEGSPSIHSAATCFVIAVDQWWKSLWTCRAEQRTYSSHRLGQAPGRFYPLTSLHWGAYLCRALYRCLYERERRCQTCLWQWGMYTEVFALKMQNHQDLLTETSLTCSLLVDEILDSASSSPRSSFLDFQNLPSRRNRWCSSSSSQAFFQPILRFTCSRWTLTVISWMFSEGIQALWKVLGDGVRNSDSGGKGSEHGVASAYSNEYLQQLDKGWHSGLTNS